MMGAVKGERMGGGGKGLERMGGVSVKRHERKRGVTGDGNGRNEGTGESMGGVKGQEIVLAK